MEPLSLPRLGLLCVLLVGLLDFSVADDCGELNPVVEPPHLVVKYGDPASAVCTAPQPVDSMGWEAQEGGPRQEGTQQIVWNLTSVTDWWLTPICYTNSKDGSCELEVPVTVYKTPDSVTARVLNHTLPLFEGHQYHLSCVVESVAPVRNLTIIWYRGDQVVGQTDYEKLLVEDPAQAFPDLFEPNTNYTQLSSTDLDSVMKGNFTTWATLTITALRVDHGAIYSCAARLDLNTSKPIPDTRSNNIQLEVLYDCGELNPVVEPPHLVVKYGDPTSAVCTAPQHVDSMGWEAPEGGPMQEDTQQIVWNLTSVTDWWLTPICYTNSKDGSCDLEVPVTVYKTPDSVTAWVVNHTLPLFEGHQYHLSCVVESVAPVRNLTIMWYRGDQVVGQTDYEKLLVEDPAQAFPDLFAPNTNYTQLSSTYLDSVMKGNFTTWDTLAITASRVDHGAIYSCAARLDLNTSKPIPDTRSNSIQLEVLYKPRMLNITGNVIVKAGNTLTLACHANANPGPSYQWRHKGTVLSNQKSNTLQIDTINVTNGGVYECTAANSQGQDSAQMTVTVHVENYGDAVVIGTWTVVCILALVIAAVCLWRKRRQQPPQ